jgi:hypothetical protein
MSLISTTLLTLAGLGLAFMVVFLIVATRSAQEVRATIFPIVREEGAVRMRRARTGAIVSGVMAAVLAGAFFVSGQVTVPDEQTLISRSQTGETQVAETGESETESAASAFAETPEPVVEAGVYEETEPVSTQPSAGSELATAKATPASPIVPTSTPTSLPSPTSRPPTTTPVPPSPTLTPISQTAPAGVEMGPISFAADINNRREPISPTTVFSDTIERVYAVFPFSGMQAGLRWTQVWYFDDQEFIRDEGAWEWGVQDRSYVYIKPVGAGDYRLDLYVGDDLISSAEFAIQGATAVGGPESSD